MTEKKCTCGDTETQHYENMDECGVCECRYFEEAPVKLKVGQAGWAVVDEDGNFIDIFTYEVKRENLVLHDTERIIEVTITPV
jgi:hypothetical protein